MKQHTYEVRVGWTGNDGEGTKTYNGSRRDHIVAVKGKGEIQGSSDPEFCGDRSRYNPEELLVAYLPVICFGICIYVPANRVTVVEYGDAASGIMQEYDGGSGEFVQVTLRPVVTVLAGDDRARAIALHDEAHCQIGELSGARQTGNPGSDDF
jgi:organic hydroperoxide reductase OsmC/OhrA